MCELMNVGAWLDTNTHCLYIFFHKDIGFWTNAAQRASTKIAVHESWVGVLHMYFHFIVLRCFPEKVGIKDSIFLYLISRVKSVINSRPSNIYNIFISIIFFH